MTRPVAILLIATFAACTADPTAPFPSSPFPGVILSRSLIGAGGSILVRNGPSCSRQMYFSFGPNTQLTRRTGDVIPPDSLVVGRSVTVEWHGDVLLSCPVKAGADRIVLEP